MKYIFLVICFFSFLASKAVYAQQETKTEAQLIFEDKLMSVLDSKPDLIAILPYDFTPEQTNRVVTFLENNQHREALNEVLEHLNNGPLRLISSGPLVSKHAIKQYYTHLFRPDSSETDIFFARNDTHILAAQYIPPQVIKDSQGWYSDVVSDIDLIPANVRFLDTGYLFEAYYRLADYQKVIKLYKRLPANLQKIEKIQKFKLYTLIQLKKFSEAEQVLTDYMSLDYRLNVSEDIIFNASALFKQAGFSDKAQSMCHEYLQKFLTKYDITDADFEKMRWFQLLPLYRYSRCAKGPDHPQTQKYWQRLNAPDIKQKDFFLMTRMIKIGQSPQPLEKLANIDGPNPALTRAFYLSYLGFALDHQDLYYEELQIARKALAKLGPAPYFDHFK